jgi:hypothetical protein
MFFVVCQLYAGKWLYIGTKKTVALELNLRKISLKVFHIFGHFPSKEYDNRHTLEFSPRSEYFYIKTVRVGKTESREERMTVLQEVV